MKRWYAVHCQPQGETKADFNLRRQGFTSFLPRYRKTVRHARQRQTVLAPLFPRYLFAELDFETERWLSVNGTYGVVGLVGFGGTPAPVPDTVMAAIRAQCDNSGVMNLAPPAFARGQSLRIVEGPFADTTGLFETSADERRVTLLLEILGRPLKVVLPVEAVTAA